MPMPPSHWMKLRQNSSPLEIASMSVRIEDPVVVNPADGFEKGVHETCSLDPEVKRQRAEQTDGRPAEGHNGHALALANHLRLGPSEKQVEQCAATDRENHRLQQRDDACILVEQAAEQREDNG